MTEIRPTTKVDKDNPDKCYCHRCEFMRSLSKEEYDRIYGLVTTQMAESIDRQIRDNK